MSTMSTDEIWHRYGYHKPNAMKAARHEAVRSAVREAALNLNGIIPASPEATKAFDALDEAMFWANAALARDVNRTKDRDLSDLIDPYFGKSHGVENEPESCVKDEGVNTSIVEMSRGWATERIVAGENYNIIPSEIRDGRVTITFIPEADGGATIVVKP